MILVSVGLIKQNESYLITKRAMSNDSFSGLWEFPGGKIEQGELPFDALVRELKEELALNILNAEPFDVFEYDYPTKKIQFHVFEVKSFDGKPSCMEQQSAMNWVNIDDMGEYQLPAANQTIVKKLKQCEIF